MPNRTLAEVFHGPIRRRTIEGHPLVVGTGLVGVEIELEGLRNVNFNSDYWQVKEDGSLRNFGREFVFRSPTGGLDLFNAVVELDSYLYNKNPDGNWRCSTHVHVDVRDTTVTKLKNLILGYTVYEKVLFRLSGMHRYHNNFCCPLGYAQNQLELLARAWRHQDMNSFVSTVVRRWDKYSALNLATLTSFGSVEFRMAEPTWRKGKLLLLCNRLLSLKKFTDSWEGSQEDLVATLISSDPRAILGRGCPKDLPEEIAEDLETGMKLAYDIIAFSNNPIPVVMKKGWPLDLTLAAIEAGRLPANLHRVPVEVLTDGSPRVDWMLSAGVRDWLIDQSRNHFEWYVSSRLCGRLNFTFMKCLLEATGVGARALLGEEGRQLYDTWRDAGCPTQPLPEQQFIPPIPEDLFFEPVEEEEEDDDNGAW